MARIRISFDRVWAEALRAQGLWNDDTLPSVIAEHAKQQPAHVALQGKAQSLTYAELWHRARLLAAGLAALGIRRGDVVASQLPNIAEFVVLHIAANAIGAVYNPVHLPYRTADLQFLLGHGGAKAFVGLRRIGDYRPAAEILARSGGLPALEHVVTVDAREEGCLLLSDLREEGGESDREEGDLAGPDVSSDDPCLLLYTSGTTSDPKGVPHDHRTLMSAARTNAAEFGLSRDDVLLTLSRFSHMWGVFSLLMGLRIGATNLLLANYAPDAFAQMVESLRPGFVFGAPVHLLRAWQEGLLDRHDFSSVRLVTTSGSTFPTEPLRAINAKLSNGEVVELWGMTETAPGAFTRPGTPIETAAGTIGRTVTGCEMRIVAANGALARTGEEGELEIRGAGVFAGYLDNPQANAASFTSDGWFRTGDLAVREAEGVYRITGRVKDVINRGGVKLNPAEIEATLMGHPRIKTCALIPIADPVYGERACCCAVVDGQEPITLDEVCAYLAEKGIGKYMWPESLRILQALPMTPTGKVRKGTLAAMIADTGTRT